MKDKLIESSSNKALQQNIKTEIESGKDPKQAAAIAYSVQRANDTDNAELLYCVIEFTESSYFGLTSKVGKQISLNEAETLIRNADKAYQTNGVKGCYDKTYLDLYVKYNNHTYKVHLLRFDVGDGPQFMNVKEQTNNVLKRIPELINNSLYRNHVKQLKDGYTGEIRNIGGKQFKGADGKIYEMPNYTYAMYCPQQNAYYGFKNQNNMPYAPAGGKKALQQIFGEGGFVSLDGMIFVKPIRDTNTILGEYSKVENGKLKTAQLIKHKNGYTFLSSEPKDDKDFEQLHQVQQYTKQKGYKALY